MKSIKNLLGKMKIYIRYILNYAYEKKCQRRIKNKDFSIICSNCIGGIIYHRLGMKFLTPTINLWFYQDDFIKFISNLEHYISKEVQFIHSQYNYPTAKLDDVQIMFNHSSSEAEAKEVWNRRRNRIHYDNLYIIMYDRDNLTHEDILNLKNIRCKRLVVLSENTYPDIDYVKTIHRNKKHSNNQNFLDRDLIGRYTFEKQFDFVAWLNDEKKY